MSSLGQIRFLFSFKIFNQDETVLKVSQENNSVECVEFLEDWEIEAQESTEKRKVNSFHVFQSHW